MGWKAFVEGGVASIVAGCSTHPLDLIKVRMQLQGEGGGGGSARSQSSTVTAAAVRNHRRPQQGQINASAGAAAASASASASTTTRAAAAGAGRRIMGPAAMGAHIVRTEGVGALYAGVSATVLRQATYSTTRMGVYDMIKRRWESGRELAAAAAASGEEEEEEEEEKKKVVGMGKKVVAGLVAGAVGAAVGSPADMAMVRMQADGRLERGVRRNYASAADAVLRTARDEGLPALWRGSSLTVVRAMLVTASQLATYDQAKDEILRLRLLPDGLPLHVAASSAAAVAASLTSNPVDVIKTRLMSMPAPPPAAASLPPTTFPPSYTTSTMTPPTSSSSSSSSSALLPSTYSGPLDCALKTVRLEGPLALYKGLLPTMLRQAPFTVILFVTLERMRKLLRDHPSSSAAH